VFVGLFVVTQSDEVEITSLQAVGDKIVVEYVDIFDQPQVEIFYDVTLDDETKMTQTLHATPWWLGLPFGSTATSLVINPADIVPNVSRE
jgi:hypothetical protein